MSFRSYFEKIKRRESPFYDRLYLLLKAASTAEVPVFAPLASILYNERAFRLTTWRWFVQNFYYTPLFKSQCRSYGKNLRILDGIPQIYGNLSICIGDDCTLHGTSTFVGSKVFDEPTLKIGNNTHLGSNLGITVGCDITIGNDVMIANGVNIFSYDAHGTNPAKRHEAPPKETGKPVIIGDNVWIAAKSVIMKGASIGRNSVVANSSVVIQKVPPDSLVIGNPARIFPLMY